jgi:hypothetical protein
MATRTDDAKMEPPKDRGGAKTTLAPGTQRRLQEKAEQEDRDFKARDELLYRRATEGVYDAETLDAVLALGGDATRSSPVREQVLPDADPGITTTTGAYRSPIDPTTAAVPASEHSEIARTVGGTPTVGSREHGTPEERWREPEGGTMTERLNALPSKDEVAEKEAAQAQETSRKNEPRHRGEREPFHQ